MLISPLGEKSPLITSGKVLMFLHLLKYRGGFFCFLISMTIILLQIGFMTVKLLQIDRERPLEIDHI